MAQDWKQRFPKLRQRVIQKLQSKGKAPTDNAFDVSVRRLAGHHGLTPAEALFVLAKDNGLSTLTDFRHLTTDEQSRVTNVIGVSRPASGRSERVTVSLPPTQQLSKVWHDTFVGKLAVSVTVAVLTAVIVAGLTTIGNMLWGL